MQPLKKFTVTLLIPQTQILEATDLQDAHNQVTTMMARWEESEGANPKVHSIVEVVEQESIDFGPAPEEPTE